MILTINIEPASSGQVSLEKFRAALAHIEEMTRGHYPLVSSGDIMFRDSKLGTWRVQDDLEKDRKKGKPRYEVQVFDRNLRRASNDQRDNIYGNIALAAGSVLIAIADPNVGSVLIRDRTTVPSTTHVSLERIECEDDVIEQQAQKADADFVASGGGVYGMTDEFRGINSSGDRVVDYDDPPRYSLFGYDVNGERIAAVTHDDIVPLRNSFAGFIGLDNCVSVIAFDNELLPQPVEYNLANGGHKPTPSMATDLDNQAAEFKAVHALSTAIDALPPIVDDDYPEMRFRYDQAVRALIDALDRNGRLDRVKQAAINFRKER